MRQLRLSMMLAILGLLVLVIPARGQLLEEVRFVSRPAPAKAERLTVGLVLDRHVYDNADLDAQGIITIAPSAGGVEASRVTLALRREDRLITEQVVSRPSEQMIAFLLPVTRLEAGEYVLAVEVRIGEERAMAEWRFRRSDEGLTREVTSTGRIRLTLATLPELGDMSWPIRTGVPFPKGALWDVSKVRLLADGEETPCQVEMRGRWSPRGSVRWLGLTFAGRAQDGQSPVYEVEYGVERAARPATAVQATDAADAVTVVTGPLKFVVRKRGYDGIHAAWFDRNSDGEFADDERAVSGSPDSAPYVTNSRGTVYRASNDAHVSVEVEQAGPLHAVVRVSGWFVSDDGDRLCKYTTYYEAFAEMPRVFVDHTVVITFDTNTEALRDAAFPMVVSGDRFAMGLDGESINGARDDRTFLVQERWRQARVGGALNRSGSQSDGWIDVGTDALGVTLAAPYVPERFPRQFSVDEERIIFHLWPADLGDTFTDEEELSERTVYQVLSAHEGPELNMRLLPKYVARITDLIGTNKLYDEERRILANPQGQNGQGVALNERFALSFRGGPISGGEGASLAILMEKDPHAAVDPEWVAASGVLGRIAGVDRENYPRLEWFMERNLLSMASWHLKENEEYGVWNFGDVHTYWEWDKKKAGLHRTWLAAHYAQTEVPWVLYGHYGSPAILDWARVNHHHVMNVDMVHYDDPTNPLPFHKTGAVYHCKGILHWGGDASHASHLGFVSHLLWSWFMTGDRRSRDVAREWHEGAIAASPNGKQGRDGQTFLGESTEYYQNWWDPRMLELVNRTVEVVLKDPPSKQHAMHWNPASFPRYYDLTRDPRMLDWLIADKEFRSNGEAYGLNAYLYLVTGDERFKDEWRNVYALVRKQYDNPSSVYDGMVDTSWLSQMNSIYQLLYMQAGMKRAGARIERPMNAGTPRIHTGTTAGGYKPVLTLGTHKAENDPLVLTLDASSRDKLAVTGPGGAPVALETVSIGGRERLAIPTAAPGGLYELVFTASDEWSAEAEFPQPLVEGGEEFFWLKAGQTYTMYESGTTGGSQFVVRPMDQGVTLTLNVRARKFPGQFILFGPAGEELVSKSSFRDRHDIEVPSTGGPYTLMATRISYIVPSRDAVATPYQGE